MAFNRKESLVYLKGVREIKRLTFIGGILLIAGTLLYGIVHLTIANYIPNMQGWSDPPGKFEQARNEIGVNIPYFLSIIFMVLGLILLFLKELKIIVNLLITEKK